MKKAFTLIELLVYMMIMGFIIIVAGRVFSDSTSMRIRSQNMLKVSEEVGKVSALLLEDISQMGVKSWGTSSASVSGNVYVIEKDTNVYMKYDINNPTKNDLSSFKLFRAKTTSKEDADIKFDSLVFRKAAFDEHGEFFGVREISLATNEDGALHRRCRTIAPSSCKSGDTECTKDCPTGIPDMDNAPEVLIANNVKRFEFNLSAPGVKPNAGGSIDEIARDTIFPLEATNPSPNAFRLVAPSSDAETNVQDITPEVDEFGVMNIKNLIKNNREDLSEADLYYEFYFVAGTGTPIYTQCLEIPITKGETYAVEFEMPFVPASLDNYDEDNWKAANSDQFLPGIDHIGVGLRYNNAHTIDKDSMSSDVLVYASQNSVSSGKIRYAEFSAKGKPNQPVCLALTLSFYSPYAATGKFSFNNFKIYKKQDGAYHFIRANNNYDNDFANIYATEDESGVNEEDYLKHKKMVKALELILEIDKNGEVAGTYSKENEGMSIAVPNNGT